MEAHWQRIVENFFGRLDGPFHFRFIVQPMMATLYAIIDGVKDAKSGKAPYFWALFTVPEHRRELIKDGWKHVGKIFVIAVILDVIYSLKVLGRIYPGEILLVSLLLAVVPYLILRGPVNRLLRMGRKQ